jgi:hypothetical protein
VAEQIGPGTLKLVVISSGNRSLREQIEALLRAHCRANDVRRLQDETFLVHTEASTAEVRDWLAPVLADGESVFVVEFERWSARGPAADRDWLRNRGH